MQTHEWLDADIGVMHATKQEAWLSRDFSPKAN